MCNFITIAKYFLYTDVILKSDKTRRYKFCKNLASQAGKITRDIPKSYR